MSDIEKPQKNYVIFAAALLALGLIVWSEFPADYSPKEPALSSAPRTLEEARQLTIFRLKELRSMSDEQWMERRVRRPYLAPSRVQAIVESEAILMQLYDIDEEGWKRVLADIDNKKRLAEQQEKLSDTGTMSEQYGGAH